MFLNALKLGQSLENPELYKSAQNAVNFAGAVLPVIAVIYPPAQNLIDADFVSKLYAAIGAINVYLTTATSKKIGV